MQSGQSSLQRKGYVFLHGSETRYTFKTFSYLPLMVIFLREANQSDCKALHETLTLSWSGITIQNDVVVNRPPSNHAGCGSKRNEGD